MLGEPGTEQFRVQTWLDNKIIGDQSIHDPFIHNKTVIGFSKWDLFKAIFRQRFEITIRVNLRATEGAIRAIMTLDPRALAEETSVIMKARALSQSERLAGQYVSQNL